MTSIDRRGNTDDGEPPWVALGGPQSPVGLTPRFVAPPLGWKALSHLLAKDGPRRMSFAPVWHGLPPQGRPIPGYLAGSPVAPSGGSASQQLAAPVTASGGASENRQTAGSIRIPGPALLRGFVC